MLSVSITLIIAGIAAAWDLKTKRIPNQITLPAIVFGIILSTYNSGINGLENALAGTFTGLALLLIPFILGGMGAGDVKLLAALGALNGVDYVIYAFLYTAIAGGAIAIILAIIKGRCFLVFFNVLWVIRNFSLYKVKQGERLMPVVSNIKFPYGIAIFAGAVTAIVMR